MGRGRMVFPGELSLVQAVSREAPGTVLLGPNMTSTLTVGVSVPPRAPINSRHLLLLTAEPNTVEAGTTREALALRLYLVVSPGRPRDAAPPACSLLRQSWRDNCRAAAPCRAAQWTAVFALYDQVPGKGGGMDKLMEKQIIRWSGRKWMYNRLANG